MTTNGIPRRLRSVLVAMGATLASILTVAGGTYLIVQYDGNLHAVEPGVFYRSAQLSGKDLRQVIEREHIKTVLNLRGPNGGKDWYDAEIQAAAAEGVKHLDYALSAQHDVTLAQMQEILRLIQSSPKPVLVHCNAGSDRTGLVSALYELSRGKDPATADQQLALRYGHFPYLGSKTIAMDKSFAVYVLARGEPAVGHVEGAPASAATK